MGAAPDQGWLTVYVVDVERCEGIEDRLDYGLRQAGLARALDAEGLTVGGWSASVTSEGGESKGRGTAVVRAAQQLRAGCARTGVPLPREEHT